MNQGFPPYETPHTEIRNESRLILFLFFFKQFQTNAGLHDLTHLQN